LADMPNLNTLISDIADGVIYDHCETAVRLGLQARILAAIGIKRRRRPVRPNWQARDRFLAPYDKRMKSALRAIWKQERRDILANMKRAPLPTPPGKSIAGVRTKADTGIVDQWLYPGGKYKALLAQKAESVLSRLISAAITRINTEYALGVNFDIVNERALEWLGTYAPQFSVYVETETLTTLRERLMSGIDAGEGMDKLRRRVQDTFDDMEKWRAERIARTETSRAAGQGTRETFKEAGFTKKVWLANPDCCTEICAPLEGKTIDMDEPFFVDPKGYSDGMTEPAHPGCRCTTSGWDDSWSEG
jgi:SPP1 gp7 family putative phage head morphogenesis protein